MKAFIKHIVFSVKDATLFCKKATFLIEKSYTHPLTLRESIQLNIHLKICINCYRYNKQSRLIEYALKNKAKNFSNLSGFKLSLASKTLMQKAIEENLKKN